MKTTPKDFFLHLGVIITLYVSVFSFLNLVFSIVNAAYPNAEIGRYYYPSSNISWPVAALIVVVPLYLLFSWLIRRDYTIVPEKRDFPLRKWLLYITLFLAGAAVAGDLIVLLYNFLDGQTITIAFILKVLAVFVVAGGVFAYYLSDLRYMIPASRNRVYAVVTLLVVIAAIVTGFMVIGSPRTQRLTRIDQEKINRLSEIQSQILSYWQAKETVPANLGELRDELFGYEAPKDPQTNEDFEYERISNTSFRLCADFNRPSKDTQNGSIAHPYYDPAFGNESFEHGEGRTCFERTIDPARYPPIKRPL